MHFVELCPSSVNKFPQFKFDLAAGNDGAGLGNLTFPVTRSAFDSIGSLW